MVWMCADTKERHCRWREQQEQRSDNAGVEVIIRSGLAGIYGVEKGPWEMMLDKELEMRKTSILGIWTWHQGRAREGFKWRYGILKVGL